MKKKKKKPPIADRAAHNRNVLAKTRAKRNRTAEARQAQLKSKRMTAEEKRQAISEARKKRYREDPEYRARMIAFAKRSYQKKKKVIEDMRNERGLVPRKHKIMDNRCPTCFRPLPPKQKPTDMVVMKKYHVRFFTIGILALHIGKTSRTVIAWIENGVMPDAMYRDKIGRRLYTQDQVEGVMSVCDRFDLRPPISFEKSGFIAALKAQWDALVPSRGIDPSLYTAPSQGGLLKRANQELPPPLNVRRKKGEPTDGKKKRGDEAA